VVIKKISEDMQEKLVPSVHEKVLRTQSVDVGEGGRLETVERELKAKEANGKVSRSKKERGKANTFNCKRQVEGSRSAP